MDLDLIKYLIETYLPKITLGIVYLIVGFWIVKKVTRILNMVMKKRDIDKGIISFTISFSRTALNLLLILSVATTLGFETTSFVAILTAMAFSIGMALQGSLSNFAGGVMILLVKPFKIGDYIEGGGFSGTVDDIQLFNTVLKTPDNKRIVIPNSSLSNSGITNYSTFDTRRVDIVFGVDYKEDLHNVKNILSEIINLHELVLKDPEPFVRLTELNASSIDFSVRAWTKTEDYWTVRFDLLEQVKDRFDKENISIPYPHITIENK